MSLESTDIGDIVLIKHSHGHQSDITRLTHHTHVCLFVCSFRNKTVCDGLADFSTLQATCGRPLGLGFNHQTGELYAADAYFGLVKVGSDGGSPTQLVGAAQNNSFRFGDGLDIDPETGIVYFTEASTNFQIK